MFDIEYGDRLVDHQADSSRRKVITLSRAVLQKLAADAKRVPEAAVRDWQEKEEAKLAEIIMSNGESALACFLSRCFGRSMAATREQAIVLAKEHIKRYPIFMRCWREDDALSVASRWLAISEKLTYIEAFEVPTDDFESMRDWAGKS